MKHSIPLFVRHSRESGNLDVFETPGFRLALAFASLAGMTLENIPINSETRLQVKPC